MKTQIPLTLLLWTALLPIKSWALSTISNHDYISLVSWNLLAPTYARPEKYPWVPLHALDWEHRQRLIVNKLKSLDADIYCLQEMEVERWDNFLEKLPDYDGVLQTMKGGHPVATAILVKRASQLEVVRTESRSRALLVVLSSSSKQPLFLANVHLDAGAENDRTRICQLRSLLKRLVRHMDIEEIDVMKDEHLEPPIIIAGDMNMLRDTDVYDFLATGTLPSDETITHRLLPLRDAYEDTPGLRLTYGGGCVLDYVWTSQSVKVLRTMPVVCESNGSTIEMPSETHPSDHLPIGVLVSYPGAPTSTTHLRPDWQQLTLNDFES